MSRGGKLKEGTKHGQQVYCIQQGDTNYFKIGVTSEGYRRRLGTLQTANPHMLKCVFAWRSPQAQKIEENLHYRYHYLNVGVGEGGVVIR